MSSVGDFATCSERIEDTPPSFREALLRRVDEQENIRHLIHSPAFVTGKFRTLASLLCVTDRRCLIVLCEKDGNTTVVEFPSSLRAGEFLLLGGVNWTEVYSNFHRQLSPAAAMLLTEGHIVIIAVEKPGWFQFRLRANSCSLQLVIP
jgi:hypothetical protein